MGGFFSTRWGWHRTRQETDPLLALDVRRLKRDGALQPGALATTQWTRGGEPSGTIHTYVDARRPNFLILDYRTQEYGGPWEPVRELVPLVTTPCHYGGHRIWFACPGCWSRRAVLFSLGGRFRCHACHDLAYSSTREKAGDRAARRTAAMQRKLGDGPNARYGIPPDKPKGMQWTTYDRLCAQFREAWIAEQHIRNAELLHVIARFDKRYGAAGDGSDRA